MYAQITTEELTALAKAKASGLAVLLYSALSAHDFHRIDGVVFPSIERLSKLLGNAYHTNSIYKSLKWLEEKGFIKRQEAKSKSRFKLVMRAVKEKAMEAIQALSPSGESVQSIGMKKRARKRMNTHSSYSKGKRKRVKSQNWTHPEHQELKSSGSALGWCCNAVYWLQNGSPMESAPSTPVEGIEAITEALKMDLHGFREWGAKIKELAVQLLQTPEPSQLLEPIQ